MGRFQQGVIEHRTRGLRMLLSAQKALFNPAVASTGLSRRGLGRGAMI